MVLPSGERKKIVAAIQRKPLDNLFATTITPEGGIDVVHVGPFLADYITTHKDIKRVVAIGPPGATKSTQLASLEEELQEKGYQTSRVSMGELLLQLEKQLGRLRSAWDQKDWDTFDDLLVRKLKALPRSSSTLISRRASETDRKAAPVIQLAEVVGIGKRGRTALERFVADMREKNRDEETLYLFFAAHPSSTDRASDIREFILQSSGSQLWQAELYLHSGAEVVGSVSSLPAQEAFESVRARVAKSGSPEAMKARREELRGEIEQWASRITLPAFEKLRGVYERYLTNNGAQTQVIDRAEFQGFVREIIYMHLLRYLLGINTPQSLVVFTQPDRNVPLIIE